MNDGVLEGQLRVFKFRSLGGRKFIVVKVRVDLREVSNKDTSEADLFVLPHDDELRSLSAVPIGECMVSRSTFWISSASDLIASSE